MLSNSFEDIIDGQFGPDEWYEYGLDRRFSLLEPNSALGQMALRFELELNEAREEYDRYREDLVGDDDPGWVVYEEELDQTIHALNIARESHFIFHGIYQRLWQVFDPRFEFAEAQAESKATGKSFYETAVNMVINRQLDELARDRDVYTPEEISTITTLIKETGLLYSLEEGVHNFEAVTSAVRG